MGICLQSDQGTLLKSGQLSPSPSRNVNGVLPLVSLVTMLLWLVAETMVTTRWMFWRAQTGGDPRWRWDTRESSVPEWPCPVNGSQTAHSDLRVSSATTFARKCQVLQQIVNLLRADYFSFKNFIIKTFCQELSTRELFLWFCFIIKCSSDID